MTRRNVLERHTDHCSRQQRQLFFRSGRTRLSCNIVRWKWAKTEKNKILISASNSADTVITTRETTTYHFYYIHSRVWMSSLRVLVSIRCVRGMWASKTPWFYNYWRQRVPVTLRTIAKFFHSRPTPGFLQIELTQYHIKIWHRNENFVLGSFRHLPTDYTAVPDNSCLWYLEQWSMCRSSTFLLVTVVVSNSWIINQANTTVTLNLYIQMRMRRLNTWLRDKFFKKWWFCTSVTLRYIL